MRAGPPTLRPGRCRWSASSTTIRRGTGPSRRPARPGSAEAVLDHPGARVLVCTGSPADLRVAAPIVERLRLDPDRWATVVPPGGVAGPSTRWAPGRSCWPRRGHGVGARRRARRRDAGRDPHPRRRRGSVRHLRIRGPARGGVTVEAGAYVGAAAAVRERLTIGAGFPRGDGIGRDARRASGRGCGPGSRPVASGPPRPTGGRAAT